MNFYSIQFLILLAAALLCYYTVFKRKQWICLLIVSAIFYYCSGVENFSFLLLTGFSTWIGAKGIHFYSLKIHLIKKNEIIEKEEKEKKKRLVGMQRRMILWIVIGINFGVLAYIKYFRVVIENISTIFQKSPYDVPIYSHVLGLVLPLGISFYIFQSIGYLIDIYNERYIPEKNFARYMLFVSYFPQMIQGPINRYDTFGTQLLQEHDWDSKHLTKAMYRIGYGLLKKYAIANILVNVIARIFDNPVRDYAGSTVLMGILLYSIQQYADFSGGIDMVLGVSELFGIQMAENFKQPYFATSLSDFWRRWHISLGKWMRDYVFYPFALTKPMKNLGKWANKNVSKHIGRVLPAALGNLLVFFIVGLWHGAQSHYILWGLYNGFIIAISDMLAPMFDWMKKVLHINSETRLYHVFQMIRTFIIVNIGWYFDRIEEVMVALYSLKKTIFSFNIGMLGIEGSILFDGYPGYIICLVVIACIIIFGISVAKECKINVREWLYNRPLIFRWVIYYAIIGMILLSFSTRVGENGGFMYANF